MAIVTFNDGPAEFGESVEPPEQRPLASDGRLRLRLRRLPVFLRVVRDVNAGTWDALDQLDDVVAGSEEVYVYVRAGFGHARGRGRFASYRHVPIDGNVPDVRHNDRWRLTVERLAVDFAAMLPAYKPDFSLYG